MSFCFFVAVIIEREGGGCFPAKEKFRVKTKVGPPKLRLPAAASIANSVETQINLVTRTFK